MEITDEEKLKMAAETFQEFFDCLGPNDIYKKIFLEVLLEEMYGQKCDLTDVFVYDGKSPDKSGL